MQEEYIFNPLLSKEPECGYCGIGTFAHRHPPNTEPKDFEIIEEESR